MRLKAGGPVPDHAANIDTSMNYIEDHHFHCRADEVTDLSTQARKINKAVEDYLNWID